MTVEDTVEDTPITDVLEEASTDEETQDTELEDIEVNFDEADDETEESETETQEAEASETEAEVEEESTEDVDEETEEVTPPVEDKAEIARKAFQEREAKRQQAKIDAQNEYIAAAETEEQTALRQLQVDAYNNKIEFNNNKLANGIDKAVANIKLFKDGTPEQKEFLAESLDDFERMYVKHDRNGDPIEVTGDVYQFLQSKADKIVKLTQVGARKQEKDRAKVKSKTMTPPAAKPKEPEVDPDLAAFDEEAYK